MADGVSTGTVCRTSKDCFQGYDDGVRISFRQNIVNSGLTGELPVEKVCQMIDQQRFDLTFILQPPTWFPGSRHFSQ